MLLTPSTPLVLHLNSPFQPQHSVSASQFTPHTTAIQSPPSPHQSPHHNSSFPPPTRACSPPPTPTHHRRVRRQFAVMKGLEVLSNVLGWTFFALWSFSNCPQIYANFRRKSVAGFSIEFAALNTLGFTLYTIYIIAGFIFQRQWHMTRSIVVQDILFATICGASVYCLAFQCFWYRSTITGHIHKVYQFVIFGITTLALYNVILGLNHKLEWWSRSEDAYTFSVLHFLGYSKSFISFIKYVPQVILNYKRQHTAGLSVGNFAMDLGGGLCSFLQMFLNGYVDTHPDGSPDFTHITSNIPKLLLSIESVMFDLIIISQHFYYRKRTLAMQRDGDLDAKENLLHDDYGSSSNNNGNNNDTDNIFSDSHGYTDNSSVNASSKSNSKGYIRFE